MVKKLVAKAKLVKVFVPLVQFPICVELVPGKFLFHFEKENGLLCSCVVRLMTEDELYVRHNFT